jgi:hypothetical protein
MNRRVVKNGCEFEALLEARPVKQRRFGEGMVLNLLQWIRPETARFTVEGEGIDVWCCPKELLDQDTEAPQRSMA